MVVDPFPLYRLARTLGLCPCYFRIIISTLCSRLYERRRNPPYWSEDSRNYGTRPCSTSRDIVLTHPRFLHAPIASFIRCRTVRIITRQACCDRQGGIGGREQSVAHSRTESGDAVLVRSLITVQPSGCHLQTIPRNLTSAAQWLHRCCA